MKACCIALQQAAATAKAKRSLHDAVSSAQRANPKTVALSVTPAASSAGAQADVVLLAGADTKQVTEKL
jgi:hypothetical protein